jgi:hypothetical protein
MAGQWVSVRGPVFLLKRKQERRNAPSFDSEFPGSMPLPYPDQETSRRA